MKQPASPSAGLPTRLSSWFPAQGTRDGAFGPSVRDPCGAGLQLPAASVTPTHRPAQQR